MKIISLHFKNLSSLKGEFKIDFTTPALANAGLFAITGPTGAGKSTILDAITLALYSYTPRLGGINKTSITEKGIIVRENTKEAFAHLVFEVNNIKYKAEWSIAITNRGNWGDVKHKLSKEEDGAFLAVTQNTSGTVDMVNEVIGIDKDQFTKAIVLSQGKFDEFLTADKGVRYELLEVITGTDIYRKIGLKVFDALRIQNEQLKDVESQLNGIEILSTEQIEAIEVNKNNLETATNELRTSLLALEKLKQTKDKIKQLIEEKAKIESEYIKFSEKEIAFQPYLVKLAEHEQALPLQVDYNKWKNAKLAIQTLGESIETNSSILLAKQKEKKELLEAVSKAISENLKEENFDDKLSQFVKKVTTLDNTIIQIDGSLKSKGEGLNTLHQQIPAASVAEIKSIQKSVVDLNKYIQKKDAELSNLKLPSGYSGADYGVLIDKLTEQNTVLSKAIGFKTDIDSLNESKKIESDYFVKLEKAFASNTKELTSLNKVAEKLNKELQDAQNLYSANQTLMSLEEYRDLLEEGEPCPCCGSKVHPFATKKPKLNDKLEEKLQAKALAVEENEAIIKTYEEALIENGANIKNAQKSIKSIDAEITGKLKLFTNCCKELSLSVDSDLGSLNAKVNEIEKNVAILKAHKTWNETKQPLTAYIKSLSAYDTEKEALEKFKKERLSLFALSSIAEYKNEVTLKWTNINRDINDTSNNIETATNNKQEKQAEFEAVNARLSFIVLQNAFDSIDAIGLLLLSDANYQLYNKQKNELAQSKVTLDTQNGTNRKLYQEVIALDDEHVNYDELKSEIEAKSKERDSKMTEIGGLTGTLSANADNLTRFAGVQAQKEVLKTEQGYYKTLADLIGDAKGDKFNSIVQRITLRHLFNMTNERLLTLMDRYQVELGTLKNEDEIWVIDTYMGDSRRVIDSVSGGERFVISLAMALSLSDLASNNVKLDSVFIDEGFGSLSQEELDSAISMLERMQVENEKTVGIISHVESLKERISTQIVVDRVQKGESKLYLKYGDGLTSLEVVK